MEDRVNDFIEEMGEENVKVMQPFMIQGTDILIVPVTYTPQEEGDDGAKADRPKEEEREIRYLRRVK